MSMPIDPTLAQRLRDSGNVSDTAWNQYVSNNPEQIAQSAPEAPAAMVADPSSLMGDEEQNEAKKAAISFKENALAQRQKEMKALGVSDEDIEAKLLPERQTLEEQKRGLMLAGEQPLGDGIQLTTDMPTETPAQVDPRDQVPSIPALAGYDLQQEAIGMAGQAGAAKAAEIGAAQGQLQTDLKNQAEAAEAQRIKEQQEIADKQAELSAEVDRVSALKVDPGRFWADKSTGQKIALGASLFLGALGAARGGENQAAAVINNAINRDLEMQQADIMQQTRGLDKKRGILAEMKSRFKDDRMAREAARMAYINDAQLKIQEMSNKYDSQIVKANATKLIGQLEVQKQAAQSQFMQQFQASKPIQTDQVTDELLIKRPDLAEKFVRGYGFVMDKRDTPTVKKMIGETDATVDNLDQLIGYVNAEGSWLENKTSANTLARTLKGQLRTFLVGSGAVTDREQKVLDDIVKNPMDIFSIASRNKAALSTLRNAIKRSSDAKLQPYFLKPISEKEKQKKLGFQPLK